MIINIQISAAELLLDNTNALLHEQERFFINGLRNTVTRTISLNGVLPHIHDTLAEHELYLTVADYIHSIDTELQRYADQIQP